MIGQMALTHTHSGNLTATHTQTDTHTSSGMAAKVSVMLRRKLSGEVFSMAQEFHKFNVF